MRRPPAKLQGELHGTDGDWRVKCKFEVSNAQTGVAFDANLLAAVGASSKVALPARKAVQLGLVASGDPIKFEAFGDEPKMVYNVTPQLLVKGVFVCDGVEAQVEAYLTCQVAQSDCDEAMADAAATPPPSAITDPTETLRRIKSRRGVIGLHGAAKLGVKINVRENCLEVE